MMPECVSHVLSLRNNIHVYTREQWVHKVHPQLACQMRDYTFHKVGSRHYVRVRFPCAKATLFTYMYMGRLLLMEISF